MAWRWCVIYVREDNDSNIYATITRLIWTIWTSLSNIPRKAIKFNHSLHVKSVEFGWAMGEFFCIHKKFYFFLSDTLLRLVVWLEVLSRIRLLADLNVFYNGVSTWFGSCRLWPIRVHGSPVDSPLRGPIMWSFDVFCVFSLKLFNKQLRCCWLKASW